jgi:DNA polymerase-1
MQNFPKRKNAWIRGIVIPSPGNILMSFDYGQIEARVIAMASRDDYLVRALWENYDIHLYWAEWVAKRDSSAMKRFGGTIGSLRSVVKNRLVFPAFFGSQETSITADLGIPVRVGRDLFAEFWNTFKGVKAWQKELLASFYDRGYITSLTGRRRRAPLTDNMVLNAGIQGAASDLVVEAGDRLSARSRREGRPELQFMLNIHDDLTFDVPKRLAYSTRGTIVEEMLRVTYDWVNTPITVEAAEGPNWFALEKVGVFSSDQKGGR